MECWLKKSSTVGCCFEGGGQRTHDLQYFEIALVYIDSPFPDLPHLPADLNYT